MPNPIASRLKQTFGPDLGQYVAMYLTIAAFSIVTLISSTPNMWQNGNWLPYVIGVLIFGVLVDRCARRQNPSRAYTYGCVVVLTVIVLALTVLSGYFFLTMMLSFLIVAVVQSDLPRPTAYVVDAALLGAMALMTAIGVNFNAAVQVLLGLSAGFVFIIAFTELAQRERQAREQLQKANQQLAEYATQVEQLATVRERNRLAREVHDTLGHYLTVINVQLEVVTKLIDSNPARAKEAAVKAKQLASEGLNEVRRSVAALRPTPLEDKPLPEAIRALIETSRDAGLMVTFEQTGTVRMVSPEIETVLYRATQESLTNIRKHAHASAANVRLAYEANAVSLRVRDNGLGRKGSEDNVGISALRERAAALNGTVLAENHLEGGFVLEVTLPLEHAV
jgi:signal transduction histidine kinase